MNNGKTIMLVAGEASGDLHGAGLMSEIRKLNPRIRFTGMGGPRMTAQGLSEIHSGRGVFGTAGLAEVLSRLADVYRAIRALKNSMRRNPPDLFVPIDFPDFNFRISRHASRLNIPVVYFISPQIWAWRRGRISVLGRMVKRVLVIFPFEEAMYRRHGVDASFVGHPFLDRVVSPPTKAERESARHQLGIPADVPVVALLPGSRPQEMKRILPPTLEAALRIERRFPGTRFPMVQSTSLRDQACFESVLSSARLPEGLSVRKESDLYPVLRSSDAAIVASGTVTVETALHLVPMVVVYRVSPVTYVLGRMFVDLEHFSMVNLVAGEEVVPELLQRDFTPQSVEQRVAAYLGDRSLCETVRKSLTDFRSRLGEPGAYRRAATQILDVVDS